MFPTGLSLAALFLLTCQISDATVKMMANVSAEHKLRQELMAGYDRFVRPVLSPLTIVNVSFLVRLVNLIDVDNKNHMVTSKLLIKQIWFNPFLTWDQAEHKGISEIRMSKDKVWVPDISLLNSANNPSLQTKHHYNSWVTVYSNGTNVWVSLAIHNSECEIKIQDFPFDDQHCVMDFASESYGANSLEIHLLQGIHTKNSKTKLDETNETDYRNLSNAEWNIREIDTKLSKENGPCCPTAFPQVKLSLTIRRIPTFYILYLLCPCAILSFLVFFSFIIPPENGERIGFCSSLLLALSVYFLLFSDILPHNSRKVSKLGVIFALIFIEAAAAVMSTLIVLKIFHATREVPAVVKFLFLCSSCASKKKKVKPQQNVSKPHSEGNFTEEPSLIVTEADFDSLPPPKEKKRAEEREEEEKQIQAEENQKSWLIVARKLDRLFFWFYFIFVFGSLFALLTFSRQLSELDIG